MGDTFDFSHALKLLRQGHRLRRVSGYTPWFEIRLNQSCKEWPVILEKEPDDSWHSWFPTQQDILANDWMVVNDDE